MLGDFFTKPLQGSLFIKFRDVILGYKHVDSLQVSDPFPPVEERVGDSRADDNGTVELTSESGTDNNGWVTVVNNKTRKQQSRAVTVPRKATALPRNARLFRESFSRNNPGSKDEV